MSSYLATLSYQFKLGEQLSDEDIRAIRSVYFILHESLEKIITQQTPDLIFGEIKFTRNNNQYAAIQPELFIAMQQTATNIKKEINQIKYTE